MAKTEELFLVMKLVQPGVEVGTPFDSPKWEELRKVRGYMPVFSDLAAAEELYPDAAIAKVMAVSLEEEEKCPE